MQALALFVIFGLFTAIVSGFVNTGSQTTQQVTGERIAAVKDFFHQVDQVLNDRVTYENMVVPAATTCQSATYAASDPRPYLCMPEIAQLATWEMGSQNAQDPWRNDMAGVVVTQRKGVGPGVLAPVTAMALISVGPDRTMGPNLKAALQTLQAQAAAGTADIRDVMRLSSDLDRNASVRTDDIVVAFSNMKTQMERWNRIQAQTNVILNAMNESYQNQYLNFLPQIYNYYQTFGTGVSIPLYAWKKNAAFKNTTGYPSLAVPDLSLTSGQLQLGVDQAFDFIQGATPLGSSMSISPSVGSSSVATWGSTEKDTLSLTIKNNGSPWGDTNGNLTFITSMTTAPQ